MSIQKGEREVKFLLAITIILVALEAGFRAVGMKSFFFGITYPTVRRNPDTGEWEEI